MRDTVLKTIARYDLLPPGMRAIVAVSGGPDSVCLVHLLREISRDAGFHLTGIAHFNHKLRGEESEDDERFVRELAASLGLPFYLNSGNCADQPGNLEQNARRARRRFFRELIESGAADRVALGHTRDDQAETVLFRLLRGAAISGLAGILPATAEGLVRPLIETRRADVRSYLEAAGLTWHEDSSNQSPDFARNRIRQDVLPRLERDWNPNLTEALAHLADVSYEEERFWGAEIARHAAIFTVRPGSVEFPAGPFHVLPRAIQRRLIRHAVRIAKGSLGRIEFDHVESVLELSLGSRSGSLTIPGLTVTRSFDRIRMSPSTGARPEPVAIQGFGTYPWQSDKSLIQIELAPLQRSQDACDTLRVEFPPEGVELRAWAPGDRYRPVGFSREWSVKELFQKARVPSWRRASWPILTSKGKILWAKQFGPSADQSWLTVREIPETD